MRAGCLKRLEATESFPEGVPWASGIRERREVNEEDKIEELFLPNQKNMYGAALALIAIMYGIMQG